MNGILYVNKTGCQWRQVPEDFGNWMTLYFQFKRMRERGAWDRVLTTLRERTRERAGKKASPTVAIIDSQSVKTALKGGQRGFDAGKKTKGRKRHIAVDTMGNLLSVVVHSAGIQDRAGARAVLVRLFCASRTIKTAFVDGGFSGALIEYGLAMFGWSMQVVKRTEQHKFVVLPKRWIVEWTLSWLGWSRRLSKDYELLPCNSEAFVKIAMIHLLPRRATR